MRKNLEEDVCESKGSFDMEVVNQDAVLFGDDESRWLSWVPKVTKQPVQTSNSAVLR